MVGAQWLARKLPLSECVLMVSGRTGFEIVQKAYFAGIPIMAAVSAPSSLAVELAEAAGVTLVGFLRERRFNVYATRAASLPSRARQVERTGAQGVSLLGLFFLERQIETCPKRAISLRGAMG